MARGEDEVGGPDEEIVSAPTKPPSKRRKTTHLVEDAPAAKVSDSVGSSAALAQAHPNSGANRSPSMGLEL